MNSALRVMLSNSNIAGCALALIAVFLYLFGVIGSLWFLITVLSYGIGFITFYQPGPKHTPEGLSTEEALEWLHGNVLPRLSGESSRLLRSILDVVAELAPRLKELERVGIVQADNRAALKLLIVKHLPESLERFLKIPALYAKTAKVDGERTAQQLLVEQLNILDLHVKELRDSLYKDDINALLVNGQFLRDKFQNQFRLT